MQLVMKRVGKDSKSGLYNINRQNMIDVIQLTPELNYFFNVHLDGIANMLPVTYCVPMKEVDNFIEEEFGTGNINFSDKSRSFLAYFLLAFSCDIVNTAYELLKYADKKMMGPNSIISAIRITLNGSLRDHLTSNVNESVKNLKAAAALKAASKSDATDADTKETKNTKKNTNTIDEDEDNNDDNNDNNDDNDNTNNNESDNDTKEKEEPPQAPAGKKNKNNGKKNTKSATS